MKIEDIIAYCNSKPNTEETVPFGPDVLVYKVLGKIFALIGISGESPRLSLKCDPDRAIELRDQYDEITPGYHLNKKHWNTLDLNGRLKSTLIKELVDHSYDLVKPKLKKKLKK